MCHDDALYKFTFYLLIYLLTYLLNFYRRPSAFRTNTILVIVINFTTTTTAWHRHISPMNFIIQQSRSFEGVCVPLRLTNCLFPVPHSQPTATELFQSPPLGSRTVFRTVASQISWGPFDRFGPGDLNFNPPGPTPRP